MERNVIFSDSAKIFNNRNKNTFEKLGFNSDKNLNLKKEKSLFASEYQVYFFLTNFIYSLKKSNNLGKKLFGDQFTKKSTLDNISEPKIIKPCDRVGLSNSEEKKEILSNENHDLAEVYLFNFFLMLTIILFF